MAVGYVDDGLLLVLLGGIQSNESNRISCVDGWDDDEWMDGFGILCGFHVVGTSSRYDGMLCLLTYYLSIEISLRAGESPRWLKLELVSIK